MDLAAWWSDHLGALEALGIYAVGIAAYTLVVTALYIPLGHRVMLGRLVQNGERVATTGRTAAYFLLFPVISFTFFLVVVGALLFLSSSSSTSTLGAQDILTIAMGTVIAIRLVAYFHESGAQELAKIMPLGLLGVVLVTNRVDSLAASLEQLKLLIEHLDIVGLYFAVLVLVEFTCRGIHALYVHSSKKGKAAKAQAAAVMRK